ncbi:MAG: DUF3500 domain-containing protein [Pirellulaceae bacterium]
MADKKDQVECSDCVSRRDFMARSAGAAVVASTAGYLASQGTLQAAPGKASAAEIASKELYATLSAEQKKVVALPWSDPRRTKINANWSITDIEIGTFFKKPQIELIHKVVKGITSEDGYDRFQKQMEHDAGGFDAYAIALFGNPDSGPFEFELTGRHLTLRADGNTTPGAAFGGPLVYGHSVKGNSDKNLFSYQTKQANEVFKALDGEQRKKALLAKAPGEGAVKLRKDTKALPGIAVGSLSTDQQELVTHTLKAVLKPYRQEDVDEAMEVIKAGGGMEKLQIAFYQSGDLDNDKVWDIWRLEGPTVVCHFRGAPHVHAYINIARRS